MAHVLMALVLAACGGGGGGGSEPPAAPDVTIRALAGSRVATNAVVGQALPSQMLTATTTGDPRTLNGRTLHVVVEDPAGLFLPDPTVSIDASTGVANLVLRGKVVTTAGTRTGNLRVNVCLDPQCTTALTGSPLTYPYEVVAVDELRAPTSVSATRTYGDAAAVTRSVALAMDGAATLSTRVQDTFDIGSGVRAEPNPVALSGTRSASGTSFAGQLEFAPMAPGRYVTSVLVDAATPGYDRLTFTQSRTVVVEYVVVDDPSVVLAFDPVVSSLDARGGLCSSSSPFPLRFRFLARSTDGVEYLRTEYLSAPAAAAGHPLASSWIFAPPASGAAGGGPGAQDLIILGCHGTARELPPGVYEAQLVYRVTKPGGAAAEVAHRVRLTP